MTAERPRFEVADVIRLFANEYRLMHGTTASQERILKDILECRTEALGGHIDKVDRCTSCGFERHSYNSCRNRHCPKCQGPQMVEWVAGRMKHILPIEYFHIVFTLPEELNPLTLGNKKAIYNILFAAASKSLQTLARDPKHLGAQIGITAVLHSWGQTMLFHPHLHCVVTGGGLSPDANQWVSAKPGFFIPVNVLSALFRGKFLVALQEAFERGQLQFGKSTGGLEDPQAWSLFRDQLYQKKWVVYAKKPFGGPEKVFRYLGRYTHRVAISNHRIVQIAHGQVSFLYKDYKNDCCKKCMTLNGTEFLRRFLLHVLPHGFVRIRHYGIYAGPNVKTKLLQAKKLLQPDADSVPQTPTHEAVPWWERFMELTGVDMMECPHCGGRMKRYTRAPPQKAA